MSVDDKRIVVMTGATSGIGANAIKQIAAQPNMHIIIGARGVKSGPEGVEVLQLVLALGPELLEQLLEAVPPHQEHRPSPDETGRKAARPGGPGTIQGVGGGHEVLEDRVKLLEFLVLKVHAAADFMTGTVWCRAPRRR